MSSDLRPDAPPVHELASGDNQSKDFATAYTFYFGLVLAFLTPLARGLGIDLHAVEDAAQSTFLAILQRWDHVRYCPLEPASFIAYLRVAARNCLLGEYRGRRRFARMLRDKGETHSDAGREPAPLDLAIAAETQARLAAAFDALPEEMKRQWEAGGLVGLKEAAEQLGVSIEELYRTRFRTRRRLRAALGD